MMNTPYMPFYTNATVCSTSDLASIESGVTHITVSNNCGNENTVASLYFTRFTQLKELVIGENSFTKKKNGFGKESNRRFYVKTCPSLRELRVGRYSFSDYVSAVIEGNDALEVIAMGELSSESFNFYSASLELKRVGWMEC